MLMYLQFVCASGSYWRLCYPGMLNYQILTLVSVAALIHSLVFLIALLKWFFRVEVVFFHLLF